MAREPCELYFGELYLGSNSIPGKSLASTVELLPSLKHLDISDNPINEESGGALTLAKALSRHLSLMDVTVGGVVIPLRYVHIVSHGVGQSSLVS